MFFKSQRRLSFHMFALIPFIQSDITSSASEETSKQLLSPDIKEIQKSFIAITSVLVILCVLGILTERYRINATRKKYNDTKNNGKTILLHNLVVGLLDLVYLNSPYS